VRLEKPDVVLRALLANDEITIIRSVHYHQYDTYFFFDDPAQGRLRYREDETLDANNNVVSGRARLTVGDETREAGPGTVIWAPADVPHGVAEVLERTVLLVGIAPPPH
jgi:hypothetical protein